MKKTLAIVALICATMNASASIPATTISENTTFLSSLFKTGQYIPNYVIIAGNGVRLRSTPSKSTKRNIVTQVNRGTILRCVGVSGNWWQVIWGNRYLWVSRDFALAYGIN